MDPILRRLRESRMSEALSSHKYVFRIPWREYKTSDYDPLDYTYNKSHMEYASDIMTQAEEDFNDIDWTKYTNRDSRVEDAGIQSIVMNFNPSGECMITVTTAQSLSDDQIQGVMSYLEGQMSDGWGEGFEQREIAHYTSQEDEWIDDEDEEDGGYYDTVETPVYIYGQFWWSDPSHPWEITHVNEISESYDRMEFPTEDEAYAYAEENGYDIDKTQDTESGCTAWMKKLSR